MAEERRSSSAGQIEEHRDLLRHDRHRRSGLCDTGGTRFEEVLEGVAIEARLPGHADAFPPRSTTSSSTCRPTFARLQRRQGAPRRDHRHGRRRRDGRHRLADPPVVHRRGYRVNPTVLGRHRRSGHRRERPRYGRVGEHLPTAPDCTLTPIKAATRRRAGEHDRGVQRGGRRSTPTSSPTVDVGHPVPAAQRGDAGARGRGRRRVGVGIVVVFAAGNGHWGFPGRHPDVISVGGVSIAQDGALRARTTRAASTRTSIPAAASGPLRPRRHAPEGVQHHAAVPEGCVIDTEHRGRQPPERRRDAEQRRVGGVQRHVGGCRRSPACAR